MPHRFFHILGGALTVVAACLFWLAPVAQAGTVSTAGGELTYTQGSNAPVRFNVSSLPFGDAPVVVYDGYEPAWRCSATDARCPLTGLPSAINVVLGDGESSANILSLDVPVPLHFTTGGGRDLVQLPRNNAANTVSAGAGDDVVAALNGTADAIDCGDGYDTVLIDPVLDAIDTTTDCERVLSAPYDAVFGPRSSELTGPIPRTAPKLAHFTFSQNATSKQLSCWVDNSGFIPCSDPYVVPPLKDGEHMITVAADLTVDGLRTGTLASNFGLTIDSVTPPAPVLEAPAAFVNTASPAWHLANEAQLTAAEAYAFCDLDAQPSYCNSKDLGAPLTLADGPHTLSARALDPAQNESAHNTYAFVVDTILPAAPKVGRPTVRGRSATVRVSSEANSRLECSVNGARFVKCSSPYTYKARTAGKLSLAFHAVDRAGNISPPTSASATIVLASLAVTTSPRVKNGKVAAVCRVRHAKLKSCSGKLTIGRRTIGSGSAKSGVVRLKLSNAAITRLAQRGSLKTTITLTAVTADGQRVQLKRAIKLVA